MTDHELAEEIERAAILLETFAESGMVDRFLTGKRTPNSFLCEEVAKSLRGKIAALRREPERQPSDRVSVPREPTLNMVRAAQKGNLLNAKMIEEVYRDMLSAAEAEKDKP